MLCPSRSVDYAQLCGRQALVWSVASIDSRTQTVSRPESHACFPTWSRSHLPDLQVNSPSEQSSLFVGASLGFKWSHRASVTEHHQVGDNCSVAKPLEPFFIIWWPDRWSRLTSFSCGGLLGHNHLPDLMAFVGWPSLKKGCEFRS